MNYRSFAVGILFVLTTSALGQATVIESTTRRDRLWHSKLRPSKYFDASAPSRRFWTEVDYLLWWRKPICPKPAALTTGSPADANPGALGQPNTRVVLGETRFEFQGASGVRPTIGANLTSDDFLSIEVSGFWLQPVYQHGRFASGPDGGPNSYLVYQTPQNEQRSIPFSTPGLVAGVSEIEGESFLWASRAISPLESHCSGAAPG